MRKIIFIAFLLTVPAIAQVSNPSIVSVSVAPSGPCTTALPNQQVTPGGVQYSCQNGTWAAIGGGGGTPASPTATGLISGYTAYLPMLEGTGTTTADISGNGNTCTFAGGANAPTWKTVGTTVVGIQFTTSTANLYCSFPASSSTADTNIVNARTVMFCGWMQPFNATSVNIPQWSAVLSYFTGGNPSALWLSSGPTGGSQLEWSYGTPGVTYSGLTNDVSTSNYIPSNGYGCVTWTLGSSGDSTVDHTYINGVETSYSFQRNPAHFWDNRASGLIYTLGGNSGNANFRFPGVITSVLAYPTVLTPNQVLYTYNVLKPAAIDARGVTNLFSPNQSLTAQLLLQGDSICGGTPNSVTSYSGAISTNTTFTVTSHCYAGQNMANSLQSGFYYDDPFLSPVATYNIAFAETGVNDGPNGATYAYGAGARINWDLDRLAKGWTVLTSTVLSRGSSLDASGQASSETFRAWAQNKPNVYLVDWANEPCLGATGAYANPGALGCFPSETGAVAAITNCALTSNVATFTATNTFVTGDQFWLINLTGNCSALNSGTTVYTVISTGLSGSQFEANITHANIVSVATTGSAFTLFQSDGVHPTQIGATEITRMVNNVLNYITGSTASAPSTTSSTTYTLAAVDRFLTVSPAGTMTLTLPACYGWSPSEPFTITKTTAQTINLTPASLNGVNFTLNGSTSALAMTDTTETVYAARLSSSTSGCGWFTR